MRGERVQPEAIKASALFTIEGELDDISGPGPDEGRACAVQGHPGAGARSTSSRPACGHYGIFSGRKYRETIYPKIRDFIARHDT